MWVGVIVQVADSNRESSNPSPSAEIENWWDETTLSPGRSWRKTFQPAWDIVEACDRATVASLPNAVEIRESPSDETVAVRKQVIYEGLF